MVEGDGPAACRRRLRFLGDVGAADEGGRISKWLAQQIVSAEH
jgi:hypothetical protein